MTIGRPDRAIAYLLAATAVVPEDSELQQALRTARVAAGEAAKTRNSGERFLLIKAWGYGFWSDVDHVLGQLLLADMTGRIPVVHWGSNSRFSELASADAFGLYFRPVSSYTIDDLPSRSSTYYPPKWSASNLRAENVQKFDGLGSRLSGLYFLNRPEQVVVSDFHTPILNLIPWLTEDCMYFGMSVDDIYRHLLLNRLTLNARISELVEDYWRARMAGGEWIAVHARGSDKALEMNLPRIDQEYFPKVDALLEEHSNLRIFLLTDSEPYLRQFAQRYGGRLTYTPATRTSTNEGVHYGKHPPRRVAEEVILDTYVAARCEFFVGNARSNVSAMIGYLKRWAPGRYFSFSGNCLTTRDLYLHEW